MAQANTENADVPDPIRQALDDAIAARGEAETALNRARIAEARGLEGVHAAQERLNAATEEVGNAKQRHILAVTEATTEGSASPENDDITKARAVEADLREKLEAVQEVVVALKVAREDSEEAYEQSNYRVLTVGDSVMVSEIDALMVTLTDLQDRLERGKLELRWLLRQGLIPFEYGNRRLRHEAMQLLDRWILPSHAHGDHEQTSRWTKVDGSGRWSRWRNALENDANAELPAQ